MRIATVLIALVLLAGASPAAEKKARKQKGPAPVAQVVLPPDAVRIDDRTYSHTDNRGKKWIYQQTPFGWSRRDADAEPAAAATPAQVETRVVEDGDTLRFERPGPFGLYKWTKKKSELTDDEQALWKQSREKTAEK